MKEQREKPIIEHFILMGDSLTDRGTLDHRKLFGLIPMAGLSGLKKKRSWFGSFTQQFTWANPVAAFIASEDIIENEDDERKRKHPSDPESPASRHSDMGDDVISGGVPRDYSLNNDKSIHLGGHNLLRSYAEGGATSENYSNRFTFNLKLFFTRKTVSNLSEKRRLLIEDDAASGITDDEKKKTLIVEWSGANDLITVNSKPTKEAVDNAINARIHNVKELIEQGYRHFSLFNLPDLSLTPRFQRKTKAERDNAKNVSVYFNEQLNRAVRNLLESDPDYARKGCSFSLFDVNSIFQEAHNHPEHFLSGIDVNTEQPYTDSDFFKEGKDQRPPSFESDSGPSAMEKSGKAWFFWDDVHPMSKVHAILGNAFFKKECKKKYEIKAPDNESLVQMFRGYYGIELLNDKRGWFSCFRRSGIKYTDHNLTLEKIFQHALKEGGHRSRKVIIELGWINEDGTITETASKNQEIKNAYDAVLIEESKGFKPK